MAILILGGAGYIGCHTVYELIQRGRDVVVADNLSTGFRKAVHPKARFYKADIRNAQGMDRLFQTEKIDGVIHFAAFSQVGESMTRPLKYYDNNVCGTAALLQAMARHDIKNIVFSSTAAVYGEPERIPIHETDSTVPTSCYGETKLAMERMLRWVSGAGDLRHVALRYFNACGAHPSGKVGEAHNPETHLIPLILQAAAGKQDKISIFGDDYSTPDGTCIRDYIHVTDLAQAHVLALDYLMEGGKSDVFNLGNGTGFSVNEVIDVSRSVTGREIAAEVCSRRPGDPARLVASSRKAEEILGWRPQYNKLDAIIGSAWSWHQNHPEGYGNKG